MRLLVREQGLPAGFSAHIFQRVHATPLCALFADAGMPGFAGHCDVSAPAACSNPERWCAGDGGANVGPLVVGELVAAQVRPLQICLRCHSMCAVRSMPCGRRPAVAACTFACTKAVMRVRPA